jgi:hypothetical protein
MKGVAELADVARTGVGEQDFVGLARDARGARGDEVVLRPRPKPRLKTLADVARFVHESFPEGRDFPDREQPLSSQIRDLDLEQD